MAQVDYSVVIPVYFNEGALTTTMTQLVEQVVEANPTLRGEVIFVDDGSEDKSFEEMLRLRETYPRLVTAIKLTRNFGQVNALLAGFQHAVGRCVVAMSADGQDPVELINEMLKAHFTEGHEIVICSREGRDESSYRILTSRIFYWIMRRLTFPTMPTGGFDFVLLGRKALAVLLKQREAHPFFQGQILWTGYRPKFINYRRRERKVGLSRWTFAKKVTYLFDGVMSYSFMPIRIISVLGAGVATLGFLYAILIFIIRLVWGLPMQGWAPLMIVILVMGGFQMLMLGIVGEYLWRTLAQVRNRELFVTEAVFERDSDDDPPMPAEQTEA